MDAGPDRRWLGRLARLECWLAPLKRWLPLERWLAPLERWLAPRDRLLAGLVLATLAVGPLWYGAGGALGLVRFGGVDFKAYYLAGLRVREGLPLYEFGHLDAVAEPRAQRFLYPPVAVVPFVALVELPPLSARAVFLLAQFGFLWASVLALARAYGHRPTRFEALAVGWLLAGLQPVGFLLRIGNVTGFLAGLACLSAAATVAPAGPDRPLAGGALAALAAAPKPSVAPIGAHLPADRRRLLGAALAGVGVVLAGLVLFGPATTRTYLDLLLGGEAWGPSRSFEPLPRHYRPFARFPGWRPVLQGGLLAAAALTAIVADAEQGETAFALGSVAVPLVAPSADTLTLVLALPGLAVLVLRAHRRGSSPAVALVGLLGVGTGVFFARGLRSHGPRLAPELPWELARSLVVLQPATVGLLVVFGVCVVRIWRGQAGDEAWTAWSA